MAKWLAREVPGGAVAPYLGYSQKCVVIDLTTPIALRAAQLTHQAKLPSVDAIIYATALETGADLLTCDAHFERLPSVIYIPKRPN